MTDSIPLSELGTSAAYAKFEKLGDKHAGRVTAVDQRPQTDPQTGAVKTFSDGRPMMLWVITIEDGNGDLEALWAKGGKFRAEQGTGESMLAAIYSAVVEAGADALAVGGQLAVAHTGLAERKPGMNPAKLFTAQYVPPAPASVPVDLFSTSDGA
jgi:hypothetical protein